MAHCNTAPPCAHAREKNLGRVCCVGEGRFPRSRSIKLRRGEGTKRRDQWWTGSASPPYELSTWSIVRKKQSATTEKRNTWNKRKKALTLDWMVMRIGSLRHPALRAWACKNRNPLPREGVNFRRDVLRGRGTATPISIIQVATG